MATLPMFDPTGQVRQVPASQAQAATAAGGKPAVKILDPQGTPRWVREEDQDAALSSGGKLAPPDAMNADGSPNTNLPIYQQRSSAGYELNQLQQGAANSLSQVGSTAERVLTHIPGIGKVLQSSPGFQRSMADDQARANAPVDTPGKMAGNAIENILEFAAGDEALKGLSLGDKVSKLGKLAATIEKYPAIARVLKVGAEQGAVGTAQGAAHGESAGQALTTGAVTGATGGVLEGAGQIAGKVIAKVAPKVRSIAGVDIPVLASQEPGAGAMASHAADIGSTPGYQAAQQQGAKDAIGNIAQGATRDSIERVNATRPQPVSDPARMLPAPADAQPFQFTMEGTPPTEDVQQGSQQGSRDYASAGTRDVPNPGYQPGGASTAPGDIGSTAAATPERSFSGSPTRQVSNWQEIAPAGGDGTVTRGGGGTLTTSDPAVAHATLSQLQGLMESDSFGKLSPSKQAQIGNAANSLSEQIDQHGKYLAQMSHFDPIDSGRAAAQVSNFRDAAAQIEGAVKPVYAKLDEVSGGQFSPLREAEKRLLKITRSPSSEEAYQNASAKLDDVRGQMQQVFADHRTAINPSEWGAAQAAWKDASTLKDLHSALERSFSGPSTEAMAASSGMPRTISGGNKMAKSLNTLLDKRGADVSRVIGADGTTNLYRIADLLKTPEGAQNAGALAKAIGMVTRRHGVGLSALVGGALGHGLGGAAGHAFGGYEGALAGIATEAAYRKAVNRIATDPAVAQRFAMAVKGNVSHRIAAPLIASMMMQGQQGGQQ